jgi:hypothetical protein
MEGGGWRVGGGGWRIEGGGWRVEGGGALTQNPCHPRPAPFWRYRRRAVAGAASGSGAATVHAAAAPRPGQHRLREGKGRVEDGAGAGGCTSSLATTYSAAGGKSPRASTPGRPEARPPRATLAAAVGAGTGGTGGVGPASTGRRSDCATAPTRHFPPSLLRGTPASHPPTPPRLPLPPRPLRGRRPARGPPGWLAEHARMRVRHAKPAPPPPRACTRAGRSHLKTHPDIHQPQSRRRRHRRPAANFLLLYSVRCLEVRFLYRSTSPIALQHVSSLCANGATFSALSRTAAI